MKHLAPSIPLALTLLAGSVPAQFVNPPSAMGAEANSRFGTPFSNTSSSLVLLHEIHGLSAFPSLSGNVVQVAWRRDNDTVVSSTDYAGFSADFTMSLSTSPRTTQTISDVFANNRGTDHTQVHSGLVNFPPQPKTPNVAGPFAYAVPLATPFPYSGANGDLLMEIVTNQPVTNPNTSLFFFDANSAGGGSTSRRLGQPCGAGSANDSIVYSNWGPGTLARTLQYNGPAGVPSSLMIGTNGPVFAGLLLPLDLAIIRAPGCFLQHDIQLGNFPGMTGRTGRLEFRFEIPMLPALAGQQVRAQFANINDPGAGNAANLSLTAGHEITLSTPTPGSPPISEAHVSFVGVAPPTASLVQQGYGRVAEFVIR